MHDQDCNIQSYSQLCEDIFVYNNCINVAGHDVVCMEIGAFDGRTYSNTLLFEERCDARCILIEPSPVSAAAIRKNRPRATLHQFAVAEKLGTAEFLGDSAVSGISDLLEPGYIERWKMNEKRKYSVLTVPMSLLLEICEVKYIDFLSIDVQGAELQVLSSMDFDLPIGTIAIELENHHPEDDARCREILQKAGFVSMANLKITEIWRNPKYYRAGELFDPDRVVPFTEFKLEEYAIRHLEQLRPIVDVA